MQETGNRLIATLPASERSSLLAECSSVSLNVGDVLADAGERIRHAYFPQVGVISLVTVLEDGSMIEAATVGDEGMFGLPLVLGVAGSPNLRAICQIKGDMLRIPAETLVRLFERLPVLHAMLLRYAQALLVQAAQSAACNRMHSVEQRAAKWLLFCHDRVQGDHFHLTQEFLSQMLGVRRASVTEVANRLRNDGLIDYHRGDTSVMDRAGLERMSCGCYTQVRDEYESYLASADADASAGNDLAQRSSA